MPSEVYPITHKNLSQNEMLLIILASQSISCHVVVSISCTRHLYNKIKSIYFLVLVSYDEMNVYNIKINKQSLI